MGFFGKGGDRAKQQLKEEIGRPWLVWTEIMRTAHEYGFELTNEEMVKIWREVYLPEIRKNDPNLRASVKQNLQRSGSRDLGGGVGSSCGFGDRAGVTKKIPKLGGSKKGGGE